jgi:hypothetical protein
LTAEEWLAARPAVPPTERHESKVDPPGRQGDSQSWAQAPAGSGGSHGAAATGTDATQSGRRHGSDVHDHNPEGAAGGGTVRRPVRPSWGLF